jgi:hypothetical protein
MNRSRTDTLKVPGATLHYEVCGTGPILLLIRAGLRTLAGLHLSGTFFLSGTLWSTTTPGGCRAALALAEQLGKEPTVFPGGHFRIGSQPEAFAGRLHEVLSTY